MTKLPLKSRRAATQPPRLPPPRRLRPAHSRCTARLLVTHTGARGRASPDTPQRCLLPTRGAAAAVGAASRDPPDGGSAGGSRSQLLAASATLVTVVGGRHVTLTTPPVTGAAARAGQGRRGHAGHGAGHVPGRPADTLPMQGVACVFTLASLSLVNSVTNLLCLYFSPLRLKLFLSTLFEI